MKTLKTKTKEIRNCHINRYGKEIYYLAYNAKDKGEI